MVTEPIIIGLGLFNGLAYGLLFLYLDGGKYLDGQERGLAMG